jgi:hypothetical protein
MDYVVLARKGTGHQIFLPSLPATASRSPWQEILTGVTYERNEEVFYTSTKKQEAHLPVANRHELLRTWYNGNERGAAHRSINQAHRVEPARLVD